MKKPIIAGDEGSLTINRGKLGSLNIYDVTEHELEALEKGGPDSIFLNFAIFASSMVISFLTTLLTVQIESTRVYLSFFVITIIGFLSALVLLILWWRSRTSIKKLVKKIKDRMPNKNLT